LTGETTSHSKTTTGTETDARIKLECNHTGNIKIGPILGCTITIADTHPPNANTINQNLHGVTYDNEGSGATEDIKVTITVDEITYTSSPVCQSFGIPATGHDMFLTGSLTAKGYTDNSTHQTTDHVGLKMDTA
jgi:hypothetical protein